MTKAIESFCLILLTAAVLLMSCILMGWIRLKPTTAHTISISRPVASQAPDISQEPYYITICTPSGGCIDISLY